MIYAVEWLRCTTPSYHTSTSDHWACCLRMCRWILYLWPPVWLLFLFHFRWYTQPCWLGRDPSYWPWWRRRHRRQCRDSYPTWQQEKVSLGWDPGEPAHGWNHTHDGYHTLHGNTINRRGHTKFFRCYSCRSARNASPNPIPWTTGVNDSRTDAGMALGEGARWEEPPAYRWGTGCPVSTGGLQGLWMMKVCVKRKGH